MGRKFNMDLEKLKELYNRIDRCSVEINVEEINFDYIQTQIGKTSHYTEELNRTLGEILVAISDVEHKITDSKFEFELKVSDLTTKNQDVQRLTTGKERQQYINYVLLKDDFKNLTSLEQELKDLQSLHEFTKKKAKDLDRVYPKLKTLWESVQTELKTIKNVGSDEKYISQVRNSIQEDTVQRKPLFLDTSVEQIKAEQYNEDEDEEVAKTSNRIEATLDDLLADL